MIETKKLFNTTALEFDFLSSKSLTSFEITTWMLESLKIYVQRLFWIQNQFTQYNDAVC